MSQAPTPMALVASLNTVIRAPKAKENELALVIPAPLNEGIAVCIIGPAGSSLIYFDKNSQVESTLDQELKATQYCSDPNISIYLIYHVGLQENVEALERDLLSAFEKQGIPHTKGLRVTAGYTVCIFHGRIYAFDPPTIKEAGLDLNTSEILPLQYYRNSKDSTQLIDLISRFNTFFSGEYTYPVVLHDGDAWQDYPSQLHPKVAALLDSIPLESSSESAYKILMDYFLKEKNRKRPTRENIETIQMVNTQLLPWYRDLSLSFRHREFLETCRPLIKARAQVRPPSAAIIAWENLLQDLRHPETLELLCLLKKLKQAYEEAGNPEALPILLEAEQAVRTQSYQKVKERLSLLQSTEQSLPPDLVRKNIEALLRSTLDVVDKLILESSASASSSQAR